MPVSPEIRKLLQQTLTIRGSQVPLHRVIDILAMEDGDVSQAINRFRDVKDPDLRRAFHNCAVLLRALEKEAGLQPAWDKPQDKQPNTTAAPKAEKSVAPPAEKKPPKPKYRPEDLQTFEDDSARGKVRVAKVYIDGASKGNPGDAGIGVALFGLDDTKIAQISRAIGSATNNIAEYTALNEALDLAQRMGVRTLHVISDSELLVKQMTGKYKIKNVDLLHKVQEARQRMKNFEKCSMNWVGRENNTLADALSTSCLPKKTPAPPKEGDHQDFMPPLDETADEGATE